MADDVNANIRVNLDTSQALAGLQSLQSRISTFNQSVIQSNSQAVAAQRGLLNNFQAQIGASRQFSTSITNVESSVGRLQTAIDKNRLSTSQYFKYGIASSKNFGRVFRQENEQITRLATERVRKLQTQYVALGQSQQGMTRALQVRPLQLFNADAAIAVQRTQMFNKLLRDGGTSLVNWGKNTQWAGRQLMVGFTVPLTIFGGMAGKIFMELEEQAINFRKVYGDIFTSEAEVQENLEAVRELTKEMTKYGLAAKETFELANIAAQAGFRGADLMAQTEEATRLAVLGQMDQAEAMRTTITLQNAFQLSNEDLADSINFLNIVENQSVLSLQDVSGAIPRVAPVIKSLGGDVRDLSVMLVAMREGGVTAAEGANALKTSLARLISPTAGATKMAKELGINLNAIVEGNQGDILSAVLELSKSMEALDELSQQRLLSEIFGKRQYARVGALFNNITNEASQAQRVLDLTAMSTEELAQTAEKELGAVEQSVATKFTAAIETLKLEIAPIGEQFLKIATPLIEFASKIFEKFNSLSPAVKSFVTVLAAGVGAVVPVVLMLVGLFGNLLGNFVKGFATLSNFFSRLRNGAEATNYLSESELEAAAAAAALDGQVTGLTASLNVQREAVDALASAYNRYVAGANAAAANLPQGFRTPTAGPPQAFARGGVVAGRGNSDNQPALLTPGEFVMNKDATQRFGPVLDAMNRGTVKGFNEGSRLAGTQFGTFQTQSTRSSVAVERLLGKIVVVSENDTLRVTEAIRQLESSNELTAKAAKSAIDELGVSVRSLPEGMAKSHVFEQSRESVSPAMVRQMVAESGSQITAPAFSNFLDKAESMPAGSFNILPRSDLVADLPKQINEGLKQGIASTDFADAFEAGGVDKWSKTVKLAGVNAEDAAPQFDLFDRKIQELARSSDVVVADFDDAERGIVSFGTLSRQAMEELEGEIPLVNQTFDTLEGRFRTFQVSLNQEMIPTLERLGFVIEKISREGEQLFRISGGTLDSPLEVRTRAQRESARGSYRGVTGAPSLSQYSDLGEAAGRPAGQGAIRGLKIGTESNSESRAAQRVADDVVDGFANQLKRGTDDVQSAARGLGGTATKAIAGKTSDIRKLLKERLNVGPIVEQEQAQLRESIALEKKLNREIERRMMLLASRGASRFGLRERAMADIAAERAAAAAPTPTVLPKTLPKLQIATQDVQNQLQRVVQESKKMAEQTRLSTKAMSKVKGAALRFGGALKSGSMKMQGAFFALDGLIFAASMMDNQLGEMAQKALPFVFGLQGLTMVLPLLANPIVLAVAAVAALAAGVWFLKSKIDQAAQKAQEFAINSEGSAKALRDFAEGLGKIDPQSQWAKVVAGVTEKNEKAFGEATEFIKSDAGQAMVSRAKSLSGNDRVDALLSELNMAIATQLIDKDTARSVAQALAVELKDPALGQALVRGVTDFSQRTGDKYLRQQKETIDDINDSLDVQITKYNEEAAIQQRISELKLAQSEGRNFDMNELLDLEAQVSNAQDMSYSLETVAKVTGNVLNASTKLSQVQASLNVQYQQGAIDLQEYENLSKQVSESQKNIADQIANIQENSSDDTFRNQMLNAAKALGITQEEVDSATTQINALQKAMEDVNFAANAENQSREIQKITDSLLAGVLTGELDSGQVGGMLDILTSGKQEYQVYVDMVQQNPTEAASILEAVLTLEKLPPQYKTSVDFDPDNFVANVGKIQVASSYFLTDTIKNAQAFQGVMDGLFSTKEVSSAEEFYQSVEGGIKNVNGALGSLDVENLIELDKFFADNKKLKKDAVVTITGISGPTTQSIGFLLDSANIKWKEFAALPNINKQIVITALLNLDQIRKQLSTVAEGLTGAAFGGGGELGGLSMMFSDALRAVDEAMNIGSDGAETPDDTGGGGGGGGDESFLEGLMKTFKANTKLFNTAEGATKKYISARGKFFGMLEQLRKEGIPSGIIAMIGTGTEGVANARELLDATAKERKELLKYYGRVVAGEAADEIRVQSTQTQIEVDALKNIQSGGLSRNLQESIMGNEKLTLAFAGVKVGSKEYKELVKIAEELLALEKERDELAKSTSEKLKDQADINNQSRQIALDAIDLEMAKNRNDLYEEFAQKMGVTPEQLQQIISLRESEIAKLERQVERYDEIIEAEQDRIEAIQREIEGYERQISLIERQNELDERRIETLNRQDELRSREADALNKELDYMSDVEQKIRDSYQERIDALDKVASVNDYIINQQRQQLGLSQAIAEGDVYAATAAIQEMRASSAGFAAEQVRVGLEGGMENQVAGLRTSGGLTREQAEARIKAIEEQSYQTSLKIRDIEDRIYARNQQIIPLKDQIYRLNENIYVIEQEIARQEGLKTDFINNQIEPLRHINEVQSRMLEDLEYEVDETNGPLAAKRDHMQRHFDISRDQENLNHNLWLQTEAIANGTAKARDRASELAKNYGDVAREALAAAAAIASISGGSPVNAYAGGMIKEYGMGGKIKKYSYGGNVLGSGGRDSVPAMLMPGEFVVRKAMVNKYGEGLMKDINMGSFAMPSYNTGAEMETPTIQSNNMVSNINAPVYNTYDMKFSINGASQSADEIANKVMFKMKQLQSQGVRSNRGY